MYTAADLLQLAGYGNLVRERKLGLGQIADTGL
jgi:hypothetical protein